MVIRRDKELQRTEWLLAIVEQIFESNDKLVWKVEISTVNMVVVSFMLRPVSELVPLVDTV